MKKTAAVLLTAAFAFSLCACSGGNGGSQATAQQKMHVGEWKSESVTFLNSTYAESHNAALDATLTVNEDGNFSFHGVTTYDETSGQVKTDLTLTGTYTIGGDILSFNGQHLSSDHNGSKLESDVTDVKSTDFTGALSKNVMTLTLNDGNVKTIVMKKTS